MQAFAIAGCCTRLQAGHKPLSGRLRRNARPGGAALRVAAAAQEPPSDEAQPTNPVLNAAAGLLMAAGLSAGLVTGVGETVSRGKPPPKAPSLGC